MVKRRESTGRMSLLTDLSKPLSYRLGPFGFLTSSAMREAGFLPNNGVHDQKLALRWIQKHIQGFGGDPTQVTYLGSSMGAGKQASLSSSPISSPYVDGPY